MLKLIKESGLWIFPSELGFKILFVKGSFFVCVYFQQQQIWRKSDLNVVYCKEDYINISIKNYMQAIAHLSWDFMYLSLV